MFAMSGLAPIAAVMLQRHDRSKGARKRHMHRSKTAPLFNQLVSVGEPCRWDPRPMPLLGGRLILEDQAEQEMHVAAVGSAFRRLGSIGSPHLAHVPYVPSDIRFRAASI
jgi:hypothetical protein